MTCTVVQEREQRRLHNVVSRAVRTGDAFAVLDPTWPQSFLGMATAQVEAAVSGGMVGDGDMVVFSSGSTGRPRGIVRTVESWQASVISMSDITGITAEDTMWLSGPLWSSLYLYGAFHAGAVGAHLIFRDGDPTGATALHCVPSQVPGLLHRAEAGGLSLVRLAVVAGDHLPTQLRKQCEAARWRVVEYSGRPSCRSWHGATTTHRYAPHAYPVASAVLPSSVRRQRPGRSSPHKRPVPGARSASRSTDNGPRRSQPDKHDAPFPAWRPN